MTVHILLEIMCLDHKPISLSVCACSDKSSCYVYFTYRCSFPRLHGSYGNIPLLYLEQRVLALFRRVMTGCIQFYGAPGLKDSEPMGSITP